MGASENEADLFRGRSEVQRAMSELNLKSDVVDVTSEEGRIGLR